MTQSSEAAIADFTPDLPLAIGLSGGADSTALLLACARRWPGQVHAFHVHHGLQAAADDFVRRCESLCAALAVPLAVRHVDARHASGESLEAAARHARYEAFHDMALAGQAQPAIKNIALAHHADDQVERSCWRSRAALAWRGWRPCPRAGSAAASPGIAPF